MKAFIAFAALFAAAQAGLIAPISTGSSQQTRSEDGLGSYAFSYDEKHSTGGTFRKEHGYPGVKVGSYGLVDIDGRQRTVNYVADAAGFRAHINTNEPGTAPSAPAAATYNGAAGFAAPVVAAASYAAPIAVAAPVVHHAAPVVHHAVAAPVAHYAAPVAHYAAQVGVAKAHSYSAAVNHGTVSHHVAPVATYAAAPVAVAAPVAHYAAPVAHYAAQVGVAKAHSYSAAVNHGTVSHHVAPVATYAAAPVAIAAPVVAKSYTAVHHAAPAVYGAHYGANFAGAHYGAAHVGAAHVAAPAVYGGHYGAASYGLAPSVYGFGYNGLGYGGHNGYNGLGYGGYGYGSKIVV